MISCGRHGGVYTKCYLSGQNVTPKSGWISRKLASNRTKFNAFTACGVMCLCETRTIAWNGTFDENCFQFNPYPELSYFAYMHIAI